MTGMRIAQSYTTAGIGSGFVPSAPIIVGVDEAGRGPLAGPVVAAAVVLGVDAPHGLGDSKALSAKRRAALEAAIQASCAWGLASVSAEEVDALNIFGATMHAMTRAVQALTDILRQDPIEVQIDGNKTPAGRVEGWTWSARAYVGGDASEPAISAASIIAKEWRDRAMGEAAQTFPHYGWQRNKGYGTREHLAALAEHGPCALHRKSFAPVAQFRLF